MCEAPVGDQMIRISSTYLLFYYSTSIFQFMLCVIMTCMHHYWCLSLHPHWNERWSQLSFWLLAVTDCGSMISHFPDSRKVWAEPARVGLEGAQDNPAHWPQGWRDDPTGVEVPARSWWDPGLCGGCSLHHCLPLLQEWGVWQWGALL